MANQSIKIYIKWAEFDSADIIDYTLKKKSVSCQKKDRYGHAHPSFF